MGDKKKRASELLTGERGSQFSEDIRDLIGDGIAQVAESTVFDDPAPPRPARVDVSTFRRLSGAKPRQGKKKVILTSEQIRARKKGK